MRLKVTRSKNSSSLYVIKSTYVKGRHSSKIVEKLGTFAELQEKLGGEDPIAWAKRYIEELNRKEAEGLEPEVTVRYSPARVMDCGGRRSFNGGYLFLQCIYYALGLHRICSALANRYSFSFNLDSVLSSLVYGRIVFPASKLGTMRLAEEFLEQPDFELQHLYRALSVLAKESDYIQSRLYKNSGKLLDRQTGVIYYDCTNYFFEIEEEDVTRRYGFSKEHRPNPIVQMGLFMDYEGIPLAFCINPGNTNEQVTLEPLERKLLDDFKLSKFVVCTDAGLASSANRKFNDTRDRAFVTTQSVKKLKKYLLDWSLSSGGWRMLGDKAKRTYDLGEVGREMELDVAAAERYSEAVFYKERGVREGDLEQNLIVTYSIKYRDYQRGVRGRQIERAMKTIASNPGKLERANANDYRRFIKRGRASAKGENSKEKETLSINCELIEKEAAFDGFYAVCTNLDDDVDAVINITRRRWEIEECFRIMKSEFKARPVYLRRDDRIRAHFLTCFISLLIYRILEKKLDYKFTCAEIIRGIRDMNFLEVKGDGYIPTYARTKFTDALHEAFGFRTDYQIVSQKKMKEILKQTKA